MPAAIIVETYAGHIQNTRYQRPCGVLEQIVAKHIKNISSAKVKSGSNSLINLLSLKILLHVQTNHGVGEMRFLAKSSAFRRSLSTVENLRFVGFKKYRCVVNGGYLGVIQKKLPQKLGSTPIDSVVPEGSAIVSGSVKEGKSPVSRKVRLYRKDNGRFVSEVKSDATGNYLFDKLPAGMAFFVVSHDSNGVYNAAVSDNITA
jgi:hypothetical protein